MNTRVRKTVISIAVIALCAVIGSIKLWTTHRLHQNRAATLSIINRTYIALMLIEQRDSKLRERLMTADESKLNEMVARLLIENESRVMAESHSNPQAPIVEEKFGNPLRIVHPITGVKEALPSDLIGKHRYIVIYSFGPNKIDEKGTGDDIYWAEP
jgi:hypothetical protein